MALTQSKEKNNLNWIWYCLVLLFSINLFNERIVLLILLLVSGITIAAYKKSYFKINSDFVIITLFSLCYFIIYSAHSIVGYFSLYLYFIAPIACFFVGYIITGRNNNLITNTIIFLVIGNFIHGFLNMLIYFKRYGYNSLERRVPDIWTEIQMSGTLQGTYFTGMVSLLFVLFILVNRKKYKLISAFIFSAIVFSLYSTFILGNRTLLAITIGVFIINTLLYLLLNLSSLKRLIKMYATVISFSIFFIIIYRMNIFGIRGFLVNSQLINRANEVSAVEDPRFEVYYKALIQMLEYPMGGYQMEFGLNYAHNLWIDTLNATGLIPFFLLILFTIKTLLNLLGILIKDIDNVFFKLLITSFISAFLLNFMVEPILEGVPYMFLSFCLISGMINKHSEIIKLNN